MADYSCEYLVVGGGPAGATTARALAKSGKDVTLLEKNFHYTKPCGGGVKYQVFEEFDIPKSLEIKRVTTFNLFAPSLRKVGVDLSAYPISIVERKSFDSKLRDLAVANGAKLIQGKYTHLDFHEDSIMVTIDEDGTQKKIETQYLIAADGANSTVRKSLFQQAPKSVLTNYVNIPEVAWESCDFYFGSQVAPHHYGWVFPHFHETNIGVAIEKESHIKEFSNSIIPNEVKTKGYPIPLWQGEIYLHENRVFFVGDAAGQVSPFTYEGIYYAIKSASILVQSINSGKPNEYQKNWERALGQRFKFFGYMQRVFLCCDFMAEKMIKLFGYPRLQKKALEYWLGAAKPLSVWKILLKLPKILLR